MFTRDGNILDRPPRVSKTLKKNGLYPMLRSGAATKALHQHYKNILEPLSLFSANESEPKESSEQIQVERPVTPVKDSVKTPPTCLSELCELIHRRICVRPEMTTVSEEDQRALGGIILAEIKILWQEITKCSCDPVLNEEENKELKCRIVTHIVLVCEQLFLHYLYLVDIFRQRRVFTDEANLCRLRGQLSVDCTKLLNVHAIRSNIITDIKASRKTLDYSDGLLERSQQTLHASVLPVHCQPSTFKVHHIENSHSSHKTSVQNLPFENLVDRREQKHQQSLVERDLREINENIKPLDLQKVYDFLPCPEVADKYTTMPCAGIYCPRPTLQKHVDQCPDNDTETHQVFKLKRHHSMPDLQAESLCEELGIKLQVIRPESPIVFCNNFEQTAKEIAQKPINPTDDLKRLLGDDRKLCLKETKLIDPDADLPPLLKAITRSKDSRLQLLQQTLKIDNFSVKWLDRNLFLGEEIKEVYKEIGKKISTHHLKFDQDPAIEPVATEVDLSKCLASSTLTKGRRKWVINPELREALESQTSKWESRKKNYVDGDHPKPEDTSSRAYKSWLQWWKSTVNSDDYLKYVSTKDSDYLGLVYHLYDSDESDDEENEKTKALALQQKQFELRQKEKLDALNAKKWDFVPGMWNVNCILLGGLGENPEPEDVESAENQSFNLTKTPQGTSPTQTLKDTKGIAKCSHSSWGPCPDLTARTDYKQLQNRLEHIWAALYVPDGERMDMAIKYSSSHNIGRLGEATEAWEKTVKLIQQRESLLAKLEQFEQYASDPDRFYEPGYRGTSIARMDESKQREKLHSKISAVEILLSKVLGEVKDIFHDTVTYKGRPYVEKMRWDKTEMLYWLQEERRKQALERVVGGGGSPVKLPALQSCLLNTETSSIMSYNDINF
ncbi:uncharacterized protein ccdc87 isoform X2 [Polyodon spathula]|uniref:uncharacterized protein ccdc87 isoform X2 n=1 Tax=Polyodon spathula TaxID=7913 RepID=UPI001B7F6EA6|nr:uncharacterized protein ccdc87 isoform X2 [Polyodon spathula]